jgi:N-acetylglutamate synthase-like GNAT family acetyltransferase
MELQIEYLSDNKGLIPTVAHWVYDEWSPIMPYDSLEEWTCALEGRLRRGQIPTTFVALLGDQPVGCASLVEHDLGTHSHLSPLLAEVYVPPAYRRRGVGSALVRRVAAEARTLGIRTVYLYTFDREKFYARLGWSTWERTDYHGKRITVMKQELDPQNHQQNRAGKGE